MAADTAVLHDDLKSQMEALGRGAKRAAAALALAAPEAKNKGLTPAVLDRLELTPERVEGMAKGLEDIATFPDPIGKIQDEWERPNGLKIARVSVPLGVIGIIYESRPNVTADAGGLCIKSGNAAILRGESESYHSSGAILDCLQDGLAQAGLPREAVQRPHTSDREAVGLLLRMSDSVDVIIPRGGRGLIERVREESRVPVMSHLDGLCHTYLHGGADKEKALAITLNAKMRRTGICGATETLLVDRPFANDVLPELLRELTERGCELRGDAEAQALAEKSQTKMSEATEEDWDTEYLAPILSVRIVDGIGEAISHINSHGSHHTEAIVTEDEAAATRFLNEVDAGIVMVNTSTQFADGGEFGMGAEIGISTGKLHARGPVGAEQLTSYKYLVRGEGQTRP